MLDVSGLKDGKDWNDYARFDFIEAVTGKKPQDN
jgi:hypothetical protein